MYLNRKVTACFQRKAPSTNHYHQPKKKILTKIKIMIKEIKIGNEVLKSLNLTPLFLELPLIKESLEKTIRLLYLI